MNGVRSEVLLAGTFFLILALLVVPLPPLALDLLLSLSLTLSIVILLLALYTQRPLDLSVFPTILLMVTLLRLGLNVGSTRLILMHGSQGSGAAGNVIEAFGDFTVGGNTIVGFVIFTIFVVINFVVITKGAGRIAEVAARFTLDAMPGKQMAIDADLNQGAIDDREAAKRRIEIQREADFYGTMDGASKFVRGDAIAGILIMLANIFGGLFLGVFQESMAVADAFQTYTILTVGDGLVTQVPALIVSTAAGVVVSRAGSAEPLAEELRQQVLLQPRAMVVAGGMLGTLALVPGMPFVPFALLAGGAYALSRYASTAALETPLEEDATDAGPEPRSEEDTLREALQMDDLELEIGYGLVSLVDADRGGELVPRIRATRKQLATELGFVVPLIHIRDNLELAPGGYTIRLRGNVIARHEIATGRLLALSPGGAAETIPGIPTRDPAFGIDAVWIQPRDRERASAAGYAVVDASTAIATHLAEVIRDHAAELLTHQHVRELLDQLAEHSPRLVEDVVPSVVSHAVLHRTLRALLAERASVRDLVTILETLAEFAPRIQDPDLLVDLVRERLGRAITAPFLQQDGALHVMTLDPALEEQLKTSVQRTDSGTFLAIDGPTLEGVVHGIERAFSEGQPADTGDSASPVLLCPPALRSSLRQILSRTAQRIGVLSHSEIPNDVQVVADGTVRLADAR